MMRQTPFKFALTALAASLPMAYTANAADIAVNIYVAPANLGSNTYNLTDLGSTDWIYWGGETTTPTDRKDGGSGLSALSYDAAGTGDALEESGSSAQPNLTWTDGTNTPSATTDLALQTASSTNIGQTFSLSAAASSSTSSLYLFLNTYRAGGTLSISLSDGSASIADQIFSSHNLNSSSSTVYKIDYSSNGGGTLDIDWTKTTGPGSIGNLRIQGAALSAIPEPSAYALIAGTLVLSMVITRRRF